MDDMASCRGRINLFRECVIVGVGAGTEGSLFIFPGEDEGGIDVIRALRSRLVDRVQRASKSADRMSFPSGGILALAWKKKTYGLLNGGVCSFGWAKTSLWLCVDIMWYDKGRPIGKDLRRTESR